MVATTSNGIAHVEKANGIFPGTSRAEYEAIEAVSQSRLKRLRQSPAHCKWEMDNPREPTEAMEFGTAFHCCALELERFDRTYCVARKFDRRTKQGKADALAFSVQNEGRTPIDADDMDAIEGMVRSIRNHPVGSVLLEGRGHNEVCIVWTDERTGLKCKGLLDRITTFEGWTVIVDLKSCEDASDTPFSRDVSNHGYYVQAPYYLDGLSSLSPLDRRFLFVAVEKQPPHGVKVYELDGQSMDLGRVTYQGWLETYAECLKQDKWPCYAGSVEPLTLPRWKFTGSF